MEAIRMYENGERTLLEVEKELGITAGLLGKWKDELNHQAKKGRSLSWEWETDRYRGPHPAIGTRKCIAETGQRNPKKSADDVLQGRQMKYRFIEATAAAHIR